MAIKVAIPACEHHKGAHMQSLAEKYFWKRCKGKKKKFLRMAG